MTLPSETKPTLTAEVFFLNSQARLLQVIERLLRTEFYRDMRIESREVASNYNARTSSSQAKRYISLLKSAVLSVRDFDIVVRTNDQTAWCYLGSYQYDDRLASGTFLALRHAEMASLFPAVAIMGRMVMLPEGIRSTLHKHPRDFHWCLRPLESSGVVLVDFSDDQAIRSAVSAVAARLKREIRSLCHFHMMTHPDGIKAPDYDELGELLRVAPEFLRSLDADLPLAVFPEVSLETKTVSFEQRSPVEIVIRNRSDRLLHSVRVRVRAPANTLEQPVSDFLDILAGGSKSVAFDLQPRAKPYLPLEVVVDVSDGEMVWQSATPLILDVR